MRQYGGYAIVGWPVEHDTPDMYGQLCWRAEMTAESLGGVLAIGPPEYRGDTPDRMMRDLVYYRFPMVRP